MNREFDSTELAFGTSMRPLLTVERAAFLSAVSEATIRRAIRDGRLACVRVRRAVRIRPEDLETFLFTSGGGVT